MFLRSTLTKLPRIACNYNSVRSCTNQNSAQLTESPSDWSAIYNFPSIKFLGGLSKLKIYQAAFTSIGVPVTMGLEAWQIVPAQSAELFAIVGLTGTISLSIYSFCAAKTIGFVYINPVLKKIRFSCIDFWDRRKNQDVTLNDLVSSDEKR